LATPEGKLRDKAMKYLRSIPDNYVRKISDSCNVGYPDIDGCYLGLAYYFELKSENGRLSKRQKYEIGKIQKAGGRAAVVSSLEQIKLWMFVWFGLKASGRRLTVSGTETRAADRPVL